ncbi:hypothetical protein EOA37_09640 [Mesorhizobium sp. M2A.F.Ca.ET.015.02.1.1]|nr:hypothetical protein EOA37_09640 [Mesorhizobium sp. M2A.F.Ca.ET.015.02.1.1]
MSVCPCCGSTIPDRVIPASELGAHLGNNNILARVVALMARSPGAWFSFDAIVDTVYRDDPNGGPLSARGSVQVSICRNRRRLNALGWDIVGRTGSGYRLIILGRQ